MGGEERTTVAGAMREQGRRGSRGSGDGDKCRGSKSDSKYRGYE